MWNNVHPPLPGIQIIVELLRIFRILLVQRENNASVVLFVRNDVKLHDEILGKSNLFGVTVHRILPIHVKPFPGGNVDRLYLSTSVCRPQRRKISNRILTEILIVQNLIARNKVILRGSLKLHLLRLRDNRFFPAPSSGFPGILLLSLFFVDLHLLNFFLL